MARKGADQVAKRQKLKTEVAKSGAASAAGAAGGTAAPGPVVDAKKKRRKRRTPHRVRMQLFKEQKYSHKRPACPNEPINRAIREILIKMAPGFRISRKALPMLREAVQDHAIETLKWANERGPNMRKQQTLTAADIAAEVKQQSDFLLRLQHVAK